jgi:hypothetical protein
MFMEFGKGNWKTAIITGFDAVGQILFGLKDSWARTIWSLTNPGTPFLPDAPMRKSGTASGLDETERATLDVYKETAAKIFNLKLAGLDAEQQAELASARETAAAILAIKGRTLDETEAKNLAAAEKTAAELIKISLENLRKALVDRTSWEMMYSHAKDATEKTKMSLDLLSGMLQDLSTDGAAVWYGFLQATGEITPAAVKAFLEILSMFNSMKTQLEKGYTIPVIVEWFMTGEGIYGKDEEPIYPWTDIGQVPSPTGSGWVDVPGGDWQQNTITGGWRNLKTGENVQYWKDRGYAEGGDFIVPPGFENDSFPMRVQSGEHVTVTPAGLSRAMVYNSGHGGITTPSQVGGSGGDISIVVNNPTPRAAPDSISRELISLNYLGITK